MTRAQEARIHIRSGRCGLLTSTQQREGLRINRAKIRKVEQTLTHHADDHSHPDGEKWVREENEYAPDAHARRHQDLCTRQSQFWGRIIYCSVDTPCVPMPGSTLQGRTRLRMRR